MQFRYITKDEFLQSDNISAHAFFYPLRRDRIEKQLAEGDTFWQCWRGAFTDEGEMIATLADIPYQVWFDGKPVAMHGIGGVSTLLEHRRHGAIRGLFAGALQDMYDNGVMFSMLYPFSYEYYAKFGYALGMQAVVLNGELSELLGHEVAPRVEQFIPAGALKEATDPTDLVSIYEAWAPRYNMTIDRSDRSWHKLLEHEPTESGRRTYVNYDADGDPVSYVVFRRGNDRVVQVLDCAWVNKEGLYFIFGLLGRMSGGANRFSWRLPQGLTPQVVYSAGTLTKAEMTYECRAMNRIVRVEDALQAMEKPCLRGSVRIRVQDDMLPQNNGTYRITLDGAGGGTVTRLKSRQADLHTTIAGLTRLVTGVENIDEAVNQPDVAVYGKDALLRLLFTKKNICLNEYF